MKAHLRQPKRPKTKTRKSPYFLVVYMTYTKFWNFNSIESDEKFLTRFSGSLMTFSKFG